MGRRAVDTTISLIVSVVVMSVLVYFFVYAVANVPVENSKRDSEETGELKDNSSDSKEAELPLCPRKPEFFITKVKVNTTPVTDFAELNRAFPDMLPGGRFVPKNCKSRQKTAVLFPYRDRERNLFLVLNNLIPFLMQQNIEFQVFIVEQAPWFDFNKCMIINIGFVEALKQGNFDCFAIHDTDFVPKDFRNYYYCGNQPRHMVVDRSDRAKRGLGYYRYFGGAILVSREQWENINGCSNQYWGWGNEDDDMYMRFIAEGYTITRYPIKIGAYLAFEHETQSKNMNRKELFGSNTERMHEEGLNTVKYEVLKYNKTNVVTWMMVNPYKPNDTDSAQAQEDAKAAARAAGEAEAAEAAQVLV
ncbi:beta-1,4-galactosyltransferase 4-like [Littorina saxatilis]|uniref:Beta-1,4-galactosyltransferase n=1 Tax=Littorina saxatilis TaxID=31220 RepID=A0AAN9AIN8_9CAEN